MLLTLEGMVRNWTQQTTIHRKREAAALDDLKAILKTRWTVLGRGVAAVPAIFIIVLIVWLALIFVIFGLFAPSNNVVKAFFLHVRLSHQRRALSSFWK